MKVRHFFADLIDATDEDNNSIPAGDVNRQSQAMWQCKWRHLVARFRYSSGKKHQQLATFTSNAVSATWWPKLELIQVMPPSN